MSTYCPERPPIHYHPGLLYVCAYCGRLLTPERANQGLEVSHGCCWECGCRELSPRLHALMDEVEDRLEKTLGWSCWTDRIGQLCRLLSALRNLASRKVELSETTAAYYRRMFL